MRRALIWILLFFGPIILYATKAQATESRPIQEITSLPSNLEVYVTPWNNWEQIRKDAVAIEADVLKPDQRAVLVTKTQDGLYVFVWLNWVYWKPISGKEPQYLIKERLIRKENIYSARHGKVTLKHGTYALVLVLSLLEKEAHYKLEEGTARKYLDYNRLLSLLPFSALEYGITVKSFDPIVWQLIVLYKVQDIEINNLIDGAIKKLR